MAFNGNISAEELEVTGSATLASATVTTLVSTNNTTGNLKSYFAQVAATEVGTASSGVIEVRTPSTTKRAIDYRVTGDTVSRFRVNGDGSAQFGDGTNAGPILSQSGLVLRASTPGGGVFQLGPQIRSTKTAAYTLVKADAFTVLEVDSASAVTVTVPSGVFVDGDHLIIRQYGAGQITLAAASGMTLRAYIGLKTAGQYSEIRLSFRSASEAVVAGQAAA